MSVEIGIMVVMCAVAAAGLTAAWYYYDQAKAWKETYEDIEREYRAESHIWHNRIAELERQARWSAESTLRERMGDPRPRGPDGMTRRMQAAEQRTAPATPSTQDQPLSPDTQDFLSALYGDDSWMPAKEPAKREEYTGDVERDDVRAGGDSSDFGSSCDPAAEN